MTNGRAVVLGDIGPWACAGQTGGRVYMRINDEWGLDREALERRLGKGAKVALLELDDEGMSDVKELLGHYAHELERSEQHEEAQRVRALAANAPAHFLMSVPEREQTDPSRYRRSSTAPRRVRRRRELPVFRRGRRCWSCRRSAA